MQFAIFADDVKIWKEIKNESDQFDFQICLNAVVEWATTWQMTISVEKCCVMKIGSSSSFKFEYDINGVPVNYVNSVKDLGVEVDANLNFSSHCSAISKKASQRANMILRTFRSRDFKFLILVFKVFVRPMLEYATPIWSPHLIKSKIPLETVQRKFTKRVFYRCFQDKSNISFSNRLALAQLDAFENRRFEFDLVFLFKVFCGDVDLNFAVFLTIDNKPKRNHHCLQLKSINYPANNFGRYSYFYRTHRIWNNLLRDIFDGVVNVQNFKRGISEVCFDDLTGY